jgi:hypothetical protein
MFVMTNDGTISEGDQWSRTFEAVLIQRSFIYNLLGDGVSVALLQGCELRNSKVSILSPFRNSY